jgi:hypothetical protein
VLGRLHDVVAALVVGNRCMVEEQMLPLSLRWRECVGGKLLARWKP